MTKIPVRRFTARALPLDDQDRVLLLRGFDPAQPDLPFWFTIGGAMEGGETLRETAARELFEEVGIRVSPDDFTGPYGTNTIEFTWADHIITQDQTFFAIRVGDAAAVSFEHMEQVERDTTTGYRWWSAAELESTEEMYFPEDLAVVLRGITATAPVPLTSPTAPTASRNGASGDPKASQGSESSGGYDGVSRVVE
ncbi:NUDIX hydrolase [Nonomuraea purpurea]|uniref:NUDIX hydrolase n=1 Tax=Nonomuraea purpurea TaxID=1849276 RepID=A0ABV8GDX3_9ACTN